MRDAFDVLVAGTMPREPRRWPIAVIACAALLALIAFGGPAGGSVPGAQRADAPVTGSVAMKPSAAGVLARPDVEATIAAR